jgi:hypothetical protein
LELDDSPTFGTATADEPAGITTTSTAVREDDCDEAFLEETFALPVMVVPGGSPVVLTRMFNVSVACPGRVPTLQVAVSGPDEVHVVPVALVWSGIGCGSSHLALRCRRRRTVDMAPGGRQRE